MPRSRLKTPPPEPAKTELPVAAAPAATTAAVAAAADPSRRRAEGAKPKASGPTAGARDPAEPAGKGKPAKPQKLEKPAKPRKALVRDSFTMPDVDFALIAALKERALGAGRPAKKSELLRAGLQALAALDSKKLRAALERLEPIKVGRPKQD